MDIVNINKTFSGNSEKEMPKSTKKVPIELSDIEKEFIDNIFKLAFEKRGWQQGQFAKELGLTAGWASNVKKYKRGRGALSINFLYEVADKLGVDPASLLPGTNPEERPDIDEYIRQMVREEIEKALKKNKS